MPSALEPHQREFFRTVADAVFSNPFGPRREEIDGRILGTSERLPHAERSARLRERVAAEVTVLERSGLAHLEAHVAEDRSILEVGFLFLGYQESFTDLDAHIDAELAATSPAGRAPLPFPAAKGHLARLRRWGFTDGECDRYLAISFQLRRAHRFIDRGLVGRSRSMIELRRQLWNAAVSADIRTYGQRLYDRMEDFSTLLLGETGSGKGRAAAALGSSGFIPFDRERGRFAESFTRAFIPINLLEFSETLLPSELFGHRKGAFTGAIEDHTGVFSRCSPYGSILLDEIGEVSTPIQIQLLRVLQDRTFVPVGGTEELRFRGRVIAATNQSITAQRREGSFRDDFYYRLSSDVITVPPLRTRLAEAPEERQELVENLVGRIIGEPDPSIVSRVLAALTSDVPADHPWPGNVRELEQAVRRILLTRHYVPDPTAASAQDGIRSVGVTGFEEGTIDARELVAEYCAHLYRRSGNIADVARRTGLDRRTVRKHLIGVGEIEGAR